MHRMEHPRDPSTSWEVSIVAPRRGRVQDPLSDANLFCNTLNGDEFNVVEDRDSP